MLQVEHEENVSTPLIHSFNESLDKYSLITSYMPVTEEYLRSSPEEGKPVSGQFPWSMLRGLMRKHMKLRNLNRNLVREGRVGGGVPSCSYVAKLPSSSKLCGKLQRNTGP